MADFEARVRLEGDARGVERAIDRLEKRLERLRQKSQQVLDGVGGSVGQKLLPPAALTRAEKLQNIFKNLGKGVSEFNKGIVSIVASAGLMAGMFDKALGSLDEQVNAVSQLDRVLMRSLGTVGSFDRRLAAISRIWKKITYDFDRYNAVAAQQLKLEDRRAEILRLQENAMRRQLQLQGRLFAGQKQIQSVRASRTGREASGFLAFSQAASATTDVDRAARRKRARTILQESDELQMALQRMETRSVSKLDAALGPATDRAATKANDLAKAWDAAGKAATKAGREAVRAADKSATAARKAADASRKALQGRLGSAAIGGAFPLLFGQSGLAALGGLIGGAVGGAGGGFAGSLVGTLIGDLINAQNQIRELAREMGLGAQETQLLSQAFRQAGADADKFQAAVQNIRGVGFAETDEFNVIRLASKLTDDYGGKVDKVAQGFANIATKGKSGLSDINKFTAQGIPILAQLEKNLGLTRSELLQLAKDGGVSAQQTADALVDIANAGRDSALATKDPWFDTWKSIKDTAMGAFDGIKALLAPLGRDMDNIALKIAQAFAKAFQDIIGFANAAAVGILNAFAGVVDTLAQGSEGLTGLPLIGGAMEEDAKRLRNLAKEARDLATSLTAVKEGAPTKPIAKVTLPGLQDDPTKDSGSKRRSRIGELTADLQLARELYAIERKRGEERFRGVAASQAALDMEEIMARKTAEIARIKAGDAPAEEKKLAIASAILDADRALLEGSYRRQEAQTKLNESFDEAILNKQNEVRIEQTKDGLARELLRAEIYINEQRAKGVQITEDQVKAYMDAVGAAYKLSGELNFQEQLIKDTVNGVGQQFAGLFDTLIQGTNDWNQVLTSTLKSLSSLLLKAGLTALGGDDGEGFFSILSGNFGKRADGGPVSANRPYLVGEEGPEMFVPGKSGTIVPNGAGGGVNSVVNVTINGDGTSNVDSSQGAELGRLINSSVTAILMRERRPGGMLAR